MYQEADNNLELNMIFYLASARKLSHILLSSFQIDANQRSRFHIYSHDSRNVGRNLIKSNIQVLEESFDSLIQHLA